MPRARDPTLRREDAAAPHRRGALRRRPRRDRRAAPASSSAARTRTRASARSTPPAAAAMPGVVAVFTGADLRDDLAAPLPCAWPVTADMENPPHWPLAVDEVCFVGDGVAVVVAETPQAARGRGGGGGRRLRGAARGRSTSRTRSTDNALVHTDLGTNTRYTWELMPDPAAVDAAFANAAHAVSERYVQQRLIPMAMEPRGVCVVPEPYRRRLHRSTRRRRSRTSSRSCSRSSPASPSTSLRVVAPAVGGGFGSKLNVYAEEALCLALAKRLGAPGALERGAQARTRWRPCTAAGMIQDIELAADADGRITAGARAPPRRHGRVPPARHARHPAARRVPLSRRLRHPGRTRSRAPACSRTGRRPTRTAARGGPRPRTRSSGRSTPWPARWGSIPPRSAGATSSRPTSSRTTSAGGSCSTAATTNPRSTRRSRWSATTTCGAEQARRRARGDHEAPRHRVLAYVEMCGLAPSRVLASLNFGAGGWEHATVRVLPTGHGRGRHRHRRRTARATRRAGR